MTRSPPDRSTTSTTRGASTTWHRTDASTYRERVLPLLAPGGRYGIVAFSQERQPSPPDGDLLTSGDLGGGISFRLEDLERIFAPMSPLDLRPVRDDVPGTFGADFLNAGVFAV